MNLILLHPNDFTKTNTARLLDRRLQHIVTVHKAEVGDELKVGLINGELGLGRITSLTGQAVEMDVELSRKPPPPLPVTLLLALPRPKMLKRILTAISSMGVKNIVLINSYRVEKSFWKSPALDEGSLRDVLMLGLEQAGDTILPTVTQKRRFKPFVEDELPDMIQGTWPLVAHPIASEMCPANVSRPITLAIGPEGGFIPYEVDKLVECGFTPIHLGPRILRVETAIPVLLGKLF